MKDDSSTIWLGNPTNRKLIASNVHTPGQWQSVTLVVDQLRATVYANAIPVAIQTWPAPIEGGGDLLTLGNNAMKPDFLTAKMAAFTGHDRALTDDQVAEQYAEDRGWF